MNVLGIFKTVTDIVVSGAVGAIVGNAIKMSTPADLSQIQKIYLGIGTFALVSMVGTKTANYTTQQIDETVTQIKEIKNAPAKTN